MLRELKAHEITTVISLKGIDKRMMGQYIVLAPTTSKAVSLLKLQPGEEVLSAEELHHQVIVEDENERS